MVARWATYFLFPRAWIWTNLKVSQTPALTQNSKGSDLKMQAKERSTKTLVLELRGQQWWMGQL